MKDADGEGEGLMVEVEVEVEEVGITRGSPGSKIALTVETELIRMRKSNRD